MSDKLSVYKLKRRLLAELFPNLCPFCGRVIGTREYWCKPCEALLPIIRGELAPPENVTRFYACCWYRGVARSAVHMLKFGCLIYPADAFGLIMSGMLKNVRMDALVPVPSGLMSVEKRGFSSADVIAKRISLRLNVPILKAVTADPGKEEQKSLTSKGRKRNAQRSFHKAKKVGVRGKRLLLIDDVATTGSTLSAVAELLLDAGAAEVSAAVFAKVPDSSEISDEPV